MAELLNGLGIKLSFIGAVLLRAALLIGTVLLRPVLLIGAVNADASAYRMLAENLSTEPYAITLPRGDWAFRLAVNKGLSELYSSPQILDIYIKWFSAIGERPDLLRAAVYIFGTLPE